MDGRTLCDLVQRTNKTSDYNSSSFAYHKDEWAHLQIDQFGFFKVRAHLQAFMSKATVEAASRKKSRRPPQSVRRARERALGCEPWPAVIVSARASSLEASAERGNACLLAPHLL